MVKKNKPIELSFECDETPFSTFIALFERRLKSAAVRSDRAKFRGLKLGNLPKELVRIENDNRPAKAGVLRIVLYPSDALLRFAAAFWARDLNLTAVKKTRA